MDGWMDGLMDRWLDEWMNRQIDGCPEIDDIQEDRETGGWWIQ